MVAFAVACALAWFAWTRPVGDGAPLVSSGLGAGKLTVDEASCLDFATVVARSGGDDLIAELETAATLEPGVGRLVAGQVTALDQLAQRYPQSDYRIVRAVSDVATAGAAVFVRGRGVAFHGEVATWSEKMSTARAVCADIAHVDTDDVEVAQ